MTSNIISSQPSIKDISVSEYPPYCTLACFIQNPKLSVLITCLVEGAIQGVTNSGNVKSALGLAKSRLGYNM